MSAIDQAPAAGVPATRFRPVLRFLAGLGLMFLAGGFTGFIAAHVARRGWDWHVTVAAALLVLTVGIIVTLVRRRVISLHWGSDLDTDYERRFGRLGLVQLLVMVGLFGLLSLLFGFDRWADIAAGRALPSDAALVIALSLAVAFAWMGWSAHAAFDDFDDRAMMIGNTVGYYLVLLLLPVWYLLALGGWLPVPGAAEVGLVLLGAAMLSSLIWAWLKYRH